MTTAYVQKSDNYSIIIANDGIAAGFELYYKGKKVYIDYVVDDENKISYRYVHNKTMCISYADNSKMLLITKFSIADYFTTWLNDQNLLSNASKNIIYF